MVAGAGDGEGPSTKEVKRSWADESEDIWADLGAASSTSIFAADPAEFVGEGGGTTTTRQHDGGAPEYEDDSVFQNGGLADAADQGYEYTVQTANSFAELDEGFGAEALQTGASTDLEATEQPFRRPSRRQRRRERKERVAAEKTAKKPPPVHLDDETIASINRSCQLVGMIGGGEPWVRQWKEAARQAVALARPPSDV